MKKKVIGFKIYYGNGITYSSRQGSWLKAPRQDVQVVILFENTKDAMGRHTRILFSGDDYYFRYFNKKGEPVWESSFTDPKKIKGHVIYGKWLKPDSKYEKLRIKAMYDYDL
ncbi:hypothetical protein ACFL25_01005 [Patescibacteria group bacterium]